MTRAQPFRGYRRAAQFTFPEMFNAAGKPSGREAWKAGWREIGGQRGYYRSAWEANYARYLEWLRDQGQIARWEHEAETFWFPKIKRGTRSYLPDFRVTENSGLYVYHEVKGWMTARSRTAIDRMRIYYPHVKLIVIDAKGYASVRRTVGKVCDFE